MASTSISHPRPCEIGSERQRLSPGVLGGHHYFRSRETWQHRAECLVEPPPKSASFGTMPLPARLFHDFRRRDTTNHANRFRARDQGLATINQTWLEGRPQDLEALIHPEITFVFPGFAGRAAGRDAFIAGFVDFCQSARIVSYHEHDHQVDLIADMAVASFGFEMIYEREGSGFRARGRDLWVFARQAGGWLACWRTMLDLHEEPASA